MGAELMSIFNSQGGKTLTAPSQSMGTNYTNMLAQFTDTTKQADWLDGWFAARVKAFRAKPGILAQIKSDAASLLIRQVSDDTKLVANTLPYAWAELMRQTAVAGDYVTPGTITATAPAAITGNTGTAVGTSSVTGPLLPGGAVGVTGAGGMVLQYVYPETVVLKCTADALTGAATLYSEPFSFTGDAITNNDPMTWDWSNVFGAVANNGSGANGVVYVTDPAKYAGNGLGLNVLQNGDYLNFTGNTANNWVYVTGVAGTGFLAGGAGTGVIGGSSNSLKFTFDSTPTLLAWKQAFANAGVAGGTAYALLPNTVYAVGYWIKADASNVGNLNITLVDNTTSLGVAVADNNAVSNTVALDISTVGTAYEFHSAYFRTPNVLPATGMSIRLDFSGSLVNTKHVSISNLAMRPVSPIYPGGPYIALFSGATGSVLNDGYNCAFANDWGNVTAKYNYANLLNILFDVRANGLMPPPIVGGGTNIANSLIA